MRASKCIQSHSGRSPPQSVCSALETCVQFNVASQALHFHSGRRVALIFKLSRQFSSAKLRTKVLQVPYQFTGMSLLKRCKLSMCLRPCVRRRPSINPTTAISSTLLSGSARKRRKCKIKCCEPKRKCSKRVSAYKCVSGRFAARRRRSLLVWLLR